MVNELGKGMDRVGRSARQALQDDANHRTVWRIRKFASQEEYEKDNPYEVSEIKGNVLLNEGINELWTIVCSSGGTKYDNTNAQLGVGDDATAEDATQTGLLGSNQTWKGMDSGYPTYGTNQKATFKATFGADEANHPWREFSVRNGATADKNLNRKVSDQGTKASGQVWELTLSITLS